MNIPTIAMTARAALLVARREELLTVKEYAVLMRLHQRSVYRRIWAHRQPGAVRCGGQWRIDLLAAVTSAP